MDNLLEPEGDLAKTEFEIPIGCHGNQEILSLLRYWSHGDDFCHVLSTLPDEFAYQNEQNLPHGFWDRPIATAWQPKSEWDSEVDMTSSCTCDVIAHMTSCVTSSPHSLEGDWSPEYASFLIFQIRQLLRELRPFLWKRSPWSILRIFLGASVVTLSLWPGECQWGNPIGSELVMLMSKTPVWNWSFCDGRVHLGPVQSGWKQKSRVSRIPAFSTC